MNSEDNGQNDGTKHEALKKAYAEVGEEARYRHKLMHNSYYLSIIVLGIFGGTAVNQFYKGNFVGLGIVSLIASLAFAFIATIIYVNNRKRVAAWAHRYEIETNLTQHDAWSVQQDVILGRREHVAGDEEGNPVFETQDKNRIDSLKAGNIPYIMAFGAFIWLIIGVGAIGFALLCQ